MSKKLLTSVAAMTLTAFCACSFEGTDYALVDERANTGGLGGDDGSGGESTETGGSTSNTGGASGGAASGGAATGGAASGGAATGGAATGGSSNRTLEWHFDNNQESWENVAGGSEVAWTLGTPGEGASMVDDPRGAVQLVWDNAFDDVCVRLTSQQSLSTIVKASFMWWASSVINEDGQAETSQVDAQVVLKSANGEAVTPVVPSYERKVWTQIDSDDLEEVANSLFDLEKVELVCLRFRSGNDVPPPNDLVIYFDDVIVETR